MHRRLQVPATPSYRALDNQSYSLPACTDKQLLLSFKGTFVNGDEVLKSWGDLEYGVYFPEPCSGRNLGGSTFWRGVRCNPYAGQMRVTEL